MKQETFEKFAGETENNFKQSEIDLFPEDWEVVRLGEVAEVKAGQSAPQGEKYFQNGKYPFIRVQHIDNNDYKIMGWDLINDMAVKDYRLKLFSKGTIVFPKSGAAVYLEKRAMLPFDAYIVSHLCAVNSKSEKLLQRFLFYFLVSQKLAKKKAEGYPTLNLSEVKEILIPLLPLSEQRKIARVLDKIQRAIELQDRIIEQAKNLKKSLMQKLFTEGLYGEEQKEMEIGLIPKSWEVVKLGEVTNIKTSTSSPTLIKEYITSRPTNSEIAKILYLKVADLNLPINTTYIIESKEIIYAPREVIDHFNVVPPFSIIFPKRGGAISTNKKRITRFYSLIDPNLAAVTPSKAINIIFLYYWFITFDLLTITDRSPIPQLNKKDIEQIRIPLPPLEEQKQIAHILSTVDRKIEVEQKRKQVLKELFKTMLHKLMSGEIRLKEVEI